MVLYAFVKYVLMCVRLCIYSEIPVFILDSWDIWLAYSTYNDDDTETLWHFSTLEYWDKQNPIPTTINSLSPSKYNN